QHQIRHHAASSSGGRRAAAALMLFTGAVLAVELSGGGPAGSSPIAAAPPGIQAPRPESLASTTGPPVRYQSLAPVRDQRTVAPVRRPAAPARKAHRGVSPPLKGSGDRHSAAAVPRPFLRRGATASW